MPAKGFTDPETWLRHVRSLGTEKRVFEPSGETDDAALNAAYAKLANGLADFVDTVRATSSTGTFWSALVMAGQLINSAPVAQRPTVIDAELSKYRQQLASAPTAPEPDYGPPRESFGSAP